MFDGKRKPIRAHIVPHSAGGSNDPANYFLLCRICHEEQPDCAPADIQMQWLNNGEDHFTMALRTLRPLLDAIDKHGVTGQGHADAILLAMKSAKTACAKQRTATANKVWAGVAAVQKS